MALDPETLLLKSGHARGRAAKAFSLVVFLSCPKER